MDAREQLRAAHDTFDRIGAEAFAERARRELLATGETARRRVDEHERVAHAAGGTDRPARPGWPLQPRDRRTTVHQPRTVQYHLHKVFQKLDISSRNQLGRVPPSRLGVA